MGYSALRQTHVDYTHHLLPMHFKWISKAPGKNKNKHETAWKRFKNHKGGRFFNFFKTCRYVYLKLRLKLVTISNFFVFKNKLFDLGPKNKVFGGLWQISTKGPAFYDFYDFKIFDFSVLKLYPCWHTLINYMFLL